MGELVEKVEKPDSFSLDSESYGLTATLSRMGVEPELLDLSEFETYEPLGILVELAQHGFPNLGATAQAAERIAELHIFRH